jgi:hypothetical protein
MYHSRKGLTIRGYVHQWPSYAAQTVFWILPPYFPHPAYSILGLQLLELHLAKVVPNLGTLPWADTCYLWKTRVAISKMQHIHSSSHPSEGGGGGNMLGSMPNNRPSMSFLPPDCPWSRCFLRCKKDLLHTGPAQCSCSQSSLSCPNLSLSYLSFML